MGILKLLWTGKGPMDGWIARAYDGGVQAAFREIIPAVVEDLVGQLQGVRRVLDVGCGPGQFTIMEAELLPEAEVYGVDLAPTMIELARGHAEQSPAGERLHFQVGDAMALPFPDDHFDAVISSGSIKQWPDPTAGLCEMHRVLVPGGRAFVAEINSAAPAHAVEATRLRMRHWFFRLIYPHVVTQGMSPDEARRACTASPFGPPAEERLLLDGVIWLIAAQKASV